MSNPTPLERTFRNGMFRDTSRDTMPGGTAWDMLDFIPNYSGDTLMKRGGFTYASSTMSGSSALGVFYSNRSPLTPAIFATDGTSLGGLYLVSTTSGSTQALCSNVAARTAVEFGGNTLIAGANTNLIVVDSAFATSSITSAPNPPLLAVYRGSVVKTGGGRNINFSKPGDHTTWDNTNAVITCPEYVRAVATTNAAMFIFSRSSTYRVTGAPPPYSGTTANVSPDLRLDVIARIGAANWISVVQDDNTIYFANFDGLYKTDGADVSDLTLDTGMSTYWRSLTSGFDESSSVVLGLLSNHLICSFFSAYPSNLSKGTNTGVLVYDTKERIWFRASNLTVSQFARAEGITDKLYGALSDEPRLAEFSSLFSPTATVKADADGVAIQPSLETPFYMLQPMGTKRFRRLYVGFDVRDAATDNPTLTVAYATHPEDTSYTTIGTLSETTAYTRKRLPVSAAADGISLKINQTNNSSVTRLYGVDVDVYAREQSRV